MWWKKLQLQAPFWIALVFIIGFALFTRLYALGEAPAGITWDEAALGYVGKMVIRTTRDEHLQRFPITFKSFGDFKSPLSFYLSGLSTTLFGLSAWAVRLPFALAGSASVGLIIWLSWKVLKNPWYALLSGFLLTVLPWHFLFSRIAFESGLTLFFFLTLLIGWLEARQEKTLSPWTSRFGFFLIAFGTVASLYTYHAAKIVIPLTFLLIAVYELWYNRSWLWKKRVTILFTLGSMALLCLPLAWDILAGPGARRGFQTSFIGALPWQETLLLFFQNLASHLNLDFLLWGKTTTLRHNTPDYGVFFIGHLILFWLGITFVLGRIIQRWQTPAKPSLLSRVRQFFQLRSTYQQPLLRGWFWLILLLIALVPAAIGTEIPHANRSLLAIVPAIMLMTLGARELQEELAPKAFASLVGSLLLLILLQFSSFWRYYFTDYQKAASQDWLEGQRQAVQLARDYAESGKHIKFSSAYGQPMIFYAFYNAVPYEMYRQFFIPGIDFGRVYVNDLNTYDVIFSTPYDPLPFEPDQIIYRQDDGAAYYVYEVE